MKNETERNVRRSKAIDLRFQSDLICPLKTTGENQQVFVNRIFALTSIRIRKHVGVFYVMYVQFGDVFRFLSLWSRSIGIQSIRGQSIRSALLQFRRTHTLDKNAVRDCSRCGTSGWDGIGGDHPRRCSCSVFERHEYDTEKKGALHSSDDGFRS